MEGCRTQTMYESIAHILGKAPQHGHYELGGWLLQGVRMLDHGHQRHPLSLLLHLTQLASKYLDISLEVPGFLAVNTLGRLRGCTQLCLQLFNSVMGLHSSTLIVLLAARP